MKVGQSSLNLIKQFEYWALPQPTVNRRGRIAVCLAIAVIMFLLTVGAGLLEQKFAARFLGTAAGGMIGIAIILWQIKWFWRFVDWLDQMPSPPSQKRLKRKSWLTPRPYCSSFWLRQYSFTACLIHPTKSRTIQATTPQMNIIVE